MANIKIILLFLIGCMGSRLFLIFMKDKIFGYIEIVIGLSFMYIFLTNSREYGLETFGDKIWWNKLRPIHGILYLISGILILTDKHSYYPLTIDIIIGFSAYLYH